MIGTWKYANDLDGTTYADDAAGFAAADAASDAQVVTSDHTSQLGTLSGGTFTADANYDSTWTLNETTGETTQNRSSTP